MSGPTISANRQIARAAGTVMAAFVISNLIGLLRSILIARAFGTGAEMEAFTPANRVSEILFTLVAGGALASAFIPTFTGLLVKEERRDAWKLASSIANWILLITTFTAVLAAVFAPQMTRYLLVPGFADQPEKLKLTVDLLRMMLPTVVIFGLSGLVMGILNAHQVFLVPALTPSMYSLGMIFGVLVLSPQMGIFGLAWGVLIGALLHLGLQLPSLLRLKGSYSLTLGIAMPAVRSVVSLLGPRLVGVAVVQLNFWINTVLASGMVEGSINGIDYAFRLMMMPQVAIAQSIAVAAMPTFSAQVARGRPEEMRSSLAAALRGVLLLSIPASIGLMILREPLTALVYQRGEFQAASTDLVSWALLWYAAGLVGHSVVEILARAFYSTHDTKTPVIVGTIAMLLNLVFSLLFAELFRRSELMPHGGLALANSLATALEMAGLLVLMRRRLKGLEGASIVKTTLQAGGASLLMGIVIGGWLYLSRGQSLNLVAVIGLGLGAIVYGVTISVSGASEARALLGVIRNKLKRAHT